MLYFKRYSFNLLACLVLYLKLNKNYFVKLSTRIKIWHWVRCAHTFLIFTVTKNNEILFCLDTVILGYWFKFCWLRYLVTYKMLAGRRCQILNYTWLDCQCLPFTYKKLYLIINLNTNDCHGYVYCHGYICRNMESNILLELLT